MGILTESEKEILMRVPTTVEEAQQILERNSRLLDLINAGKGGRVNIGCPHCKDFRCSGCAWQLIGEDAGWGGLPCCRVEFGGIRLGMCSVVSYGCDSAQVEEDIAAWSDYLIERDRAFLLGHMEWAAMVIAQGGIPWPAEAGDPVVEREDE